MAISCLPYPKKSIQWFVSQSGESTVPQSNFDVQQQSPSSINSFGSPSISLSPADDVLHHELDIPLFPNDSTSSQAGLQTPFYNGFSATNSGNDHTVHGPLYSYSAPALQSSSELYQDELKLAVEHLVNTVRLSVVKCQVPQLHDAKDLLRVTLHKLDRLIQEQIDLSQSLADTGSRASKFICLLCVSGQRKLYNNRPSFRRHVADEHYPRFIYRCLDDTCAWKTRRKDKVHLHLRNNHGFQWRATREQINLVETRVPPPRACGQCRQPVDSWEGYFKCVSEHCRVAGTGSASTSASQSRRNSDDRGQGSGGPGNNESQYPGISFGPSNDQAPSASGNGENTFFGTGYHNRQYVNPMTYRGKSSAPATPHNTNSGIVSDADVSRPLGFEDSLLKETRCHGPTSLMTHHRAMVKGVNSATCCRDTARQVSGPQESQPSKCRTEDSNKREYPEGPPQSKLLSRQVEKLRREQSEGQPEKPENKCTACGHVFDLCPRCRQSKPLSGTCHQCADQICHITGFKEVESCRSSNWASDVDGQHTLINPVSGATSSLPSAKSLLRSGAPGRTMKSLERSEKFLSEGVSSVSHELVDSSQSGEAKPDGQNHEHCTPQQRSFLKAIPSIDTNVAISAKIPAAKELAANLHTQEMCLSAKMHELPISAPAPTPPKKVHEQGTFIKPMALDITRRSRIRLCSPSIRESSSPCWAKERATRKKGTAMLRSRLHIVDELLALRATTIKRRTKRKCLTDRAPTAGDPDLLTACACPDLANSEEVVSTLLDAVMMLDTFVIVIIISVWIATVVPDTEGQRELMLVMWSYIIRFSRAHQSVYGYRADSMAADGRPWCIGIGHYWYCHALLWFHHIFPRVTLYVCIFVVQHLRII
ncbi:putative C2H2 zinc finger domain protein [Aspergillus saccharolyticus JOP 1030-1]|uniref:C2H2-type domain-containing protein n=1 Tax=Aspergillus saccharolyticus JOP 1030-1 TaxID=1450539 RepID=A0A318ZK12_9EURO|nr:hypothetical protein BP01DRAFT_399438 [Aspergillus saccharolyticus JOP 1030-1]PYH44893.1 hypothetical protein BP01DRAFT_399438 [Aspergillus saccharolyticus JOP 1030-1]